MAENKTKQTANSPHAFVKRIADDQRRSDCLEMIGVMQEITGHPPKMWGTSIVGFGDYRYKYASGRENDWFLVGFSPRKQDLTLYIMAGFDKHDALLSKLGKYKTGKSCLYIKRLSDVDTSVLQDLIATSIKHLKKDD